MDVINSSLHLKKFPSEETCSGNGYINTSLLSTCCSGGGGSDYYHSINNRIDTSFCSTSNQFNIGSGKRPCFSKLRVYDYDIVKIPSKYQENSFIYGFVCSECGSFTIIDKYSLSNEIIINAPLHRDYQQEILDNLKKETDGFDKHDVIKQKCQRMNEWLSKIV